MHVVVRCVWCVSVRVWWWGVLVEGGVLSTPCPRAWTLPPIVVPYPRAVGAPSPLLCTLHLLLWGAPVLRVDPLGA